MVLRTKEVNARIKQVVLRTKELNACTKQLILRTKEVNARTKQLILRTKEVNARIKQVILRTKEVNARIKQVILRTKQVVVLTNRTMHDRKEANGLIKQKCRHYTFHLPVTKRMMGGMFSHDTDGKITFKSFGETVSGEFEMTTLKKRRGQQDEKVTIKGSFTCPRGDAFK